MSDTYMDSAKRETLRRFDSLKEKLADAEELISGKACVYATGSFGRLEAGPHSDLDLFIVVGLHPDKKDREGNPVRFLDGVAEIKLKYKLIEATRECGIAEFDGGGKYLESHDMKAFVNDLGTRNEDYNNTLTGRLLLLLESRPLLGETLYRQLLQDVIDAYFRDFAGNEGDFLPAFMTNDILRMWRTFCVNYENERRKPGDGFRVKNLKLKYSRMLTCYSAIAYLLLVHTRAGTVTPLDVQAMVSLTPTERLDRVMNEGRAVVGSNGEKFVDLIREVLGDYARFLQLTHKKKDELLTEYQKNASAWKSESYSFGRKFAEAVALLGQSKQPFDGLYVSIRPRPLALVRRRRH